MHSKTVCPICKRAHLGVCRYAAKNKDEKPRITISPKIICNGVTWYHTELAGNKRIFFTIDPEMLENVKIATSRNFDLTHENFRGFSLLPEETPETVAIFCCNTIDAVKRGVIRFDYLDDSGYDSFIEDDADDWCD